MENNNRQKEGMQRLTPAQRPFTKLNFYLMGGCLLLIVVGFLLMTGSGSTPDGGFNPDIFSTRRIVVGPTLAFLGFLLMAFAIIWEPKKKEQALSTPEQEVVKE